MTAYPIDRRADDIRLSPALIDDVARVLVDHGYPPVVATDDVLRLQEALFSFVYRPRPSRRRPTRPRGEAS